MSTPVRRCGTTQEHIQKVSQIVAGANVHTNSSSGWNRKIAYCIAFSNDGATDVTRRYVRNPRHYFPRTRCTEEVLLWIMHEIRKIRRENLDKSVRHQLMREDEREERELRTYVAHSLASDMINSMPGALNPLRGDEVKTASERQQDAAVQWADAHHTDQPGP